MRGSLIYGPKRYSDAGVVIWPEAPRGGWSNLLWLCGNHGLCPLYHRTGGTHGLSPLRFIYFTQIRWIACKDSVLRKPCCTRYRGWDRDMRPQAVEKMANVVDEWRLLRGKVKEHCLQSFLSHLLGVKAQCFKQHVRRWDKLCQC